MTRRSLLVVALLGASLLSGCPLFWLGDVSCNGSENCPGQAACVEGRCVDGYVDPGLDGGGRHDGGVPGDDGGDTVEDSGVTPDAGPGDDDDSGTPEDSDAGAPPVDAGEPFELGFTSLVDGLQGDVGHAVASFSDGSVVLVGNIGGEATAGVGGTPITLPDGSGDVVFVARINADGSAAWAKVVGGSTWEEGMAVAISDDESRVFFGGEITGDSTFDPGGASEMVIEGYGIGRDGFLGALNATTGALDWYQMIGGTQDHDIVNGLAYSAVDDTIVAVGEFHGTSSFDRSGVAPSIATYQAESSDFFVAKYDAATGDFVWVRTGSCGDAFGVRALDVHDDGRVAVGRSLNGFLRIPDDPEPHTFPVSGSASRLWVASFAVDGAFEWAYIEPTTDYTGASSLSFFDDGAVLVGGYRNPDNTIGGESTLLLRLDTEGGEVWEKSSTGEGAADVVVLHDGGFLTLEFSYHSVTHGAFTASAPGGGDAFIAGYDAAGAVRFVKAFGGEEYEYPGALSHSGGHVAFTGDFRGPFTVYGDVVEPYGGGGAVVIGLLLVE